MKTPLKKNEEVILLIRKHWLFLAKPILGVLIMLSLAYVSPTLSVQYLCYMITGLSFVWLVYRMLDRGTNIWVVTNLRVIDEYGVFSNNSKETPLDKINNVSYSQSFLGIMLKYGNVQIQSAAESGSTIHKMVESPNELKDTITQYQERYKQEQMKEQAQLLANAVGDKKESGVDITQELTKLHSLKEKGIITEEEFQKGKNKILNT